jgi:hypothetical protein
MKFFERYLTEKWVKGLKIVSRKWWNDESSKN